MQISQFVIDLFIVYFACPSPALRPARPEADRRGCAAYSYFAAEYTCDHALPRSSSSRRLTLCRRRQWPTYGSCTGTEPAAIMGCSILTSYLFLVRPSPPRRIEPRPDSNGSSSSSTSTARPTTRGSSPSSRRSPTSPWGLRDRAALSPRLAA